MNQKAENPQAPVTESNWTPTSWQLREAKQQATYPDQAELQKTLIELSRLPPLVTSWEILALKEQIAQAQAGNRDASCSAIQLVGTGSATTAASIARSCLTPTAGSTR